MNNRVKRVIAALYALLTIVMSTIGAVPVVAYAATNQRVNWSIQHSENTAEPYVDINGKRDTANSESRWSFSLNTSNVPSKDKTGANATYKYNVYWSYTDEDRVEQFNRLEPLNGQYTIEEMPEYDITIIVYQMCSTDEARGVTDPNESRAGGGNTPSDPGYGDGPDDNGDSNRTIYYPPQIFDGAVNSPVASVKLNTWAEWTDIEKGEAKLHFKASDINAYAKQPTDYIIAVDASSSTQLGHNSSTCYNTSHYYKAKEGQRLVWYDDYYEEYDEEGNGKGDIKYHKGEAVSNTMDIPSSARLDKSVTQKIGVFYDEREDGTRDYSRYNYVTKDGHVYPRMVTGAAVKNATHYDESGMEISDRNDSHNCTSKLQMYKTQLINDLHAIKEDSDDAYRIAKEEYEKAGLTWDDSKYCPSRVAIVFFKGANGGKNNEYIKDSTGASSEDGFLSIGGPNDNYNLSGIESNIGAVKQVSGTPTKSALKYMQKMVDLKFNSLNAANDPGYGHPTKLIFISDGVPTDGLKVETARTMREQMEKTARDMGRNIRVYSWGLGFYGKVATAMERMKVIGSSYTYNGQTVECFVNTTCLAEKQYSQSFTNNEKLIHPVEPKKATYGTGFYMDVFDRDMIAGEMINPINKVLQAQINTDVWEPMKVSVVSQTDNLPASNDPPARYDANTGLLRWELADKDGNQWKNGDENVAIHDLVISLKMKRSKRYECTAEPQLYGGTKERANLSDTTMMPTCGMDMKYKIHNGPLDGLTLHTATEKPTFMYQVATIAGTKKWAIPGTETDEIKLYLNRISTYAKHKKPLYKIYDAVATKVGGYHYSFNTFKGDTYAAEYGTSWQNGDEEAYYPLVLWDPEYLGDDQMATTYHPVGYYISEDLPGYYMSDANQRSDGLALAAYYDKTDNEETSLKFFKSHYKADSQGGKWVLDFTNEPIWNDVLIHKTGDKISTDPQEDKDPSGYPYLHGAEFTVYEWSSSKNKWHEYHGGRNTINAEKVTKITEASENGEFTHEYYAGGNEKYRLYYTEDNKGKFCFIETKTPEGYSQERDSGTAPQGFVPLTKETLENYDLADDWYKRYYLTVPSDLAHKEERHTFDIQNLTSEKNIVIHKVDGATNKPLSGAEFAVYEWDNTVTNGKWIPYMTAGVGGQKQVMVKETSKGTYRTNAALRYTTKNEGKFAVVETKSPTGYYPDYIPGYTPDGSAEDRNTDNLVLHPVTVVPGDSGDTLVADAGKKTFSNRALRQKIEIRKVDSLTGMPLSGADFKVYQWSKATQSYYEYSYASDGAASAKKIKFSQSGNGIYYSDNYVYWTPDNQGKFYVQESVVPGGYMGDWADGVDQNETSMEEGFVKHEFTINPLSPEGVNPDKYVILSNCDEENTIKNTSINFTLRIQKSGEIPTNNHGKLEYVTGGLSGGWYAIRALKDVTYKSISGRNVTVKAGEFVMLDEAVSLGELDLEKYAGEANGTDIRDAEGGKTGLSEKELGKLEALENPVIDAENNVITFENGESVDHVYITGVDGTVDLENFPVGEYEVIEVKAPEGYTHGATISEYVHVTSTETAESKERITVDFINARQKTIIDHPTPVNPTVPKTKEPSLKVTKKAAKEIYKPGDTAKYTVTVENTGELSIHDITLTDYMDGYEKEVIEKNFSLDPGEVKTFTYDRYIDSHEEKGKSLINTAVARGTVIDPDADENAPDRTIDASDRAKIVVDTGAINVIKTADKNAYEPGETAYYTIKVTNTSDFTLYNVRVTESLDGLTFLSAGNERFNAGDEAVYINYLDAGETATLRYSYVIPKDYSEDVLRNIVVATGDSNASPAGAIKVIKTADKHTVAAGETVTYTVTTTNTGNVALSNVTLVDSMGSAINVTEGAMKYRTLEAGDSVTTVYTYVVPADAADGQVIPNTVTVTSESEVTDENGNKLKKTYSDDDSDTVTVADSDVPHMKVIKEALTGAPVSPGETVDYRMTVINDGDKDLFNIKLADSFGTGTWVEGNSIEKLEVGDSAELIYRYTIPSGTSVADGDRLTNVVTAKGKDGDGTVVSDKDDYTVVVKDARTYTDTDEEVSDVQTGAIKVTKTAGCGSHASVGDTIDYTITVTNTGRDDLQNVVVKDYLAGGHWKVNGKESDETFYEIGDLSAGESKELHYIYKAGSELTDTVLTNIARADGDTVPVSEENPSIHVYDSDSVDVNFGRLIGVRKIGVKNGEETPVEGATLAVYAAEDLYNVNGEIVFYSGDKVDEAQTNENGYAMFTADLPIGKYYVQETKAADGYHMSTDKIVFDSSKYAEFQRVGGVYVGGVIKDTTAYMKLHVLDEYKRTPLAGTILKITDSKGNVVTVKDSNGDAVEAITMTANTEGFDIQGLETGEVYTLTEITPRDGYFNKIISAFGVGGGKLETGAGSTRVKFRIPTVRTSTDDDGSVAEPEVFELTITNKPIVGVARVYKTGEILESWSIVDRTIHFVKSLFTYITGPLDQVSFAVVAMEDIEYPDGFSGKVFSEGDVVKLIYNDIETDAVGVTDKAGLAVFKGLYPGKYAFIETNAKTGYVKTDKKFPFTIVTSGTSEETVDATEGTIEVKNDRQKATIKVYKYDAVSKNMISSNSVEVGLYAEDSVFSGVTGKKLFGNGTLLERATTKSGAVTLTADLPRGNYYIKELKAPAGYKLSNKKYKFSIGSSKSAAATQIIEIKIYDEPENGKPGDGGTREGSDPHGPSNGDLPIKKTGPATSNGGETIPYTLDKIENATGKTLDNFVVQDTLPTMTSLKTLTTGTYNDSNVKINVYYKTSKSTDWKEWKKGLSSTTATSLSTSELGLKDSYVTAFMLTYSPSVKADFKNLTPISYNVRVSRLVKAGSKLTNKSKITAWEPERTGTYAGGSNTDTGVLGTRVAPISSPKTGDSSTIFMDLMIAGASLAVILGVILQSIMAKRGNRMVPAMAMAGADGAINGRSEGTTPKKVVAVRNVSDRLRRADVGQKNTDKSVRTVKITQIKRK